MSKKPKKEANLPSVSKQTAGGVTGAVIGGVVAGPVGAVAGGVVGALVGNSSAKGEKPIKRAAEAIRSAGMRGAKAIKAASDRHKSHAVNRVASKPAVATKKPKTKAAAKITQSKVASPKKGQRTAKHRKK
jgi:hypothetical protein